MDQDIKQFLKQNMTEHTEKNTIERKISFAEILKSESQLF